jgi:hypothetical protein
MKTIGFALYQNGHYIAGCAENVGQVIATERRSEAKLFRTAEHALVWLSEHGRDYYGWDSSGTSIIAISARPARRIVN